jgi:hypothetical protein
MPTTNAKKKKEGREHIIVYLQGRAEQEKKKHERITWTTMRSFFSFLPTATTNSNTVRKQARGRRDER